MHKKYKNNYYKFLIAQILDNTTNKLIGTSVIITSFALFLGLSDNVIGVYTIIGSIACVFQLFSAPIYSKISQNKIITMWNYILYRLTSFIIIFIPFISSNILIRSILFIGLFLLYDFFGQIGYVTIVNWKMSILKAEDRAKYFSQKHFIFNILLIIITLTMGVLIDKFKILGIEYWGYVLLFTVAFILTAIDVTLRFFTNKPQIEEDKVNIKDVFTIPFKDSVFKRILIFSVLYNFSLTFGIQYLTLYQLKYLGFTVTFSTMIAIIVMIISAVSGVFWSKVLKNLGWKKVLIYSCILNTVYFLGYAFCNNNLIFLLPILSIAFGFSESAYSIFENNGIYENSKENFKTLYVSFEKFVKGISVMLVPFISYFLISSGNNEFNIRIIFGITSFLFLINIFYLIRNVKFNN